MKIRALFLKPIILESMSRLRSETLSTKTNLELEVFFHTKSIQTKKKTSKSFPPPSTERN